VSVRLFALQSGLTSDEQKRGNGHSSPGKGRSAMSSQSPGAGAGAGASVGSPRGRPDVSGSGTSEGAAPDLLVVGAHVAVGLLDATPAVAGGAMAPLAAVRHPGVRARARAAAGAAVAAATGGEFTTALGASSVLAGGASFPPQSTAGTRTLLRAASVPRPAFAALHLLAEGGFPDDSAERTHCGLDAHASVQVAAESLRTSTAAGRGVQGGLRDPTRSLVLTDGRTGPDYGGTGYGTGPEALAEAVVDGGSASGERARASGPGARLGFAVPMGWGFRSLRPSIASPAAALALAAARPAILPTTVARPEADPAQQWRWLDACLRDSLGDPHAAVDVMRANGIAGSSGIGNGAGSVRFASGNAGRLGEPSAPVPASTQVWRGLAAVLQLGNISVRV